MSGAGGVGGAAFAQPPGQPGGQGVRWAASMQNGPLVLEASRANVWTVQERGSTVQRVLLRGDVHVRLGVYSFRAARASVWVERVGGGVGNDVLPPVAGNDPAGPSSGKAVYQVAVYFDRVANEGSGAEGDVAGGGGLSASGDRLLVTALLDAEPVLRADSLKETVPVGGAGGGTDAFMRESERRLSRFVAAVSGEPMPAEDEAGATGADAGAMGAAEGIITPGMSQPFEPDSPLGDEASAMYDDAPAGSAAERLRPLFASEGTITLAAGEATLVAGATAQDEDSVIVTGGVVVLYADPKSGRTLQISAESAVAFLTPRGVDEKTGKDRRAFDFRQFGTDAVRGIYVEGNVQASDGRSTLRGPKIYYDVAANRAVVVDAVFHTYDARRGLPLYVRAKQLRQTAQNQIEARDVTLANSSFFEPHLSLGATSITVTQERQAAGQPDRFYVEGRGMTIKASGTPFFYYPRFAGDIERFPLKEVRFENSSDSGFAIKTGWDLFGLLGFDPPKGVRADLLIDGYTRRGLGLGVDGGYNVGDTKGSFLAYILPNDNGRDTLSSGTKRDVNDKTRGLILADHRWLIDDKWSVLLEGSYISDENFVEAFYEPLAETRREFTTAAELRRIDANTSLNFLGKGNLNDFTSNEYLLQSQGYTVSKLPEVFYARVADDLLGGIKPGLLTYSSEFRLTNMAISFTDKTPSDFGFDTNQTSQDAFGLAPSTNIGDALRADGYSESSVLRFDTRHELSMPLKAGAFNITPFTAARFTGYDTDFDRFNGGDDQEKYRVWSSLGGRVSTSFQKIDDSVESQFFDLHKIRHIIEPSVTGWVAGTTIEQDNLPVYDDQVESLADGAVVKTGIRQTFQTQRGGEGRYRTVDVLKLNTELVHSSSDTPTESPIMRFFDYRPEFSQLGDFGTLDAVWQVTDATALTYNTVYDFDMNQPARTTTGLLIQHTPDFATFLESHYLNARDATYVSAGADYRLTDKYTVGVVATYDVDLQDFQELSARINREFPNLVVSLKLRYNNITDEVGIGFVMQPLSRDARKQNLQRLGRDRLDAGETFQSDAFAPAEPPGASRLPVGGSGVGGMGAGTDGGRGFLP